MHRGNDLMLHLPEIHPHYAQVQGEMAILNATLWYSAMAQS